MAVNRLIFIRPGETDWNRQGRWQGWVATPLNEHGRQQAQKLARCVRNIGMAALYSSDLRRAVETAEMLTEQLSFKPVYDERLRERKIGEWQGLTPEEMSEWYPEAYNKAITDPENFPVPGGESRNDVRQRMVACFNDILAEAKGETVGILSHTTAMKLLLLHLLPQSNEREISLNNSSVTTLVRDGAGWRMVAVDDVMHLEGLETKSVGELEYGP